MIGDGNKNDKNKSSSLDQFIMHKGHHSDKFVVQHFADVSTCLFMKNKLCKLIKISLKFHSKFRLSMVHVMAGAKQASRVEASDAYMSAN